jgi:hypothetical protein
LARVFEDLTYARSNPAPRNPHTHPVASPIKIQKWKKGDPNGNRTQFLRMAEIRRNRPKYGENGVGTALSKNHRSGF